MSVWHLNEEHDIHLNGGQIDVLATGAHETAQSIETRLLTYLREYWLDLSFGTPWFQVVFVKPVEIPKIEAALRRVILASRGVSSFVEGEQGFSADYDGSSRAMTVRFEVNTIYNEETAGGEIVV